MRRSNRLNVTLILWFVIYVILFSRYDFTGWRYLYVRVLVDNEYTESIPDWQETIPQVIEETSEFYEVRFRIKLVPVSIDAYKSEKPRAHYEELIQQDRNDGSEILIGFTGRELINDSGSLSDGITKFFTIQITSQYQNRANQADLLKHELGHLFWAFHQGNSIMDHYGSIRGKEFDNLNWVMVQTFKYRNFGFSKLVYKIYKKFPTNRIMIKGF